VPEKVAEEINNSNPLGLAGKNVTLVLTRYKPSAKYADPEIDKELRYTVKIVGVVKDTPKYVCYGSLNMVGFIRDFTTGWGDTHRKRTNPWMGTKSRLRLCSSGFGCISHAQLWRKRHIRCFVGIAIAALNFIGPDRKSSIYATSTLGCDRSFGYRALGHSFWIYQYFQYADGFRRSEGARFWHPPRLRRWTGRCLSDGSLASHFHWRIGCPRWSRHLRRCEPRSEPIGYDAVARVGRNAKRSRPVRTPSAPCTRDLRSGVADLHGLGLAALLPSS